MENHFLSIEECNELLNEWSGQTIKIIKHELDDVDEVLFDLSKITYATGGSGIDGYGSTYTLQLNGTGEIQTDIQNTYQNLPSSIYEIPIEDTTLYEYDGTCLILSTERAVYKIERVPK